MASDLKLLLQADDHVAFRFRRRLRLYDCDIGRAGSPITADFTARNNVHMKMRDALTGNHDVVLNQVEPIGVVRSYKGSGSPADGVHHSRRLFIGEVEQRRRVTSRNNEDLSKLELGPVYERERQVGLFDDSLARTACDDLAKIARGARDGRLAPIRTPGSRG